MTESKEPDLNELLNLPEEDLEDILANVRAGAKNAAEAFDFDDATMNAIEEVALGLYRSEMYDKASLVYGFALRMDPERSTCWRGLGACAQVNKAYDIAVVCFQAALERDAGDLISKACLGECFCLGGRTEEGFALLREVVEVGASRPELKDYVARARAVLDEEKNT